MIAFIFFSILFTKAGHKYIVVALINLIVASCLRVEMETNSKRKTFPAKNEISASSLRNESFLH